MDRSRLQVSAQANIQAAYQLFRSARASNEKFDSQNNLNALLPEIFTLLFR